MTEIDITTLNPDLWDYVTNDQVLGWRVVHPFLNLSVSDPAEIATANRAYTSRSKALEAAITNEDWHSFVFIHERYQRFHALMQVIEVYNYDDPRGLWPLIGDVWIDTESSFRYRTEWIKLWSRQCASKHRVMTKDERKALAALPRTVNVWRGVSHLDFLQGLSWTTDRDKAIWFAKRGPSSGYLASGTIRRNEVLAYFDGRNESEIVALPESIRGISIEQIVGRHRSAAAA